MPGAVSPLQRLIQLTQQVVASSLGPSDGLFSVDSLSQLFQSTLLEAEAEMGHCNVMIIGKTGVGKSTLVNAVFKDELASTGVGKPVTQHIRQYTKPKCPITIYDTPGMELAGEQNQAVRLEVAQCIDELRYKDPEQHIHIIWYCIHHEAQRIEETELEWLKALDIKGIPVILILTQYLDDRPSQFLLHLEHLNLPVRNIIPVLALPKQITSTLSLPAHGLDRLIGVTLDLLPEVAQLAFVKQQLLRVDLKAQAAYKYVSGYVASAGFIGAVPIPFADAPLLITAQVGMIANISFIFGYSSNPSMYVSLIGALAGIGGAVVAGRTVVSNLLKLIPGVGSLAGGIIQSTTAATLTLSIGLAYIEVMKAMARAEINGIQLSEADIRTMFVEEYKEYAESGRHGLKPDPRP